MTSTTNCHQIKYPVLQRVVELHGSRLFFLSFGGSSTHHWNRHSLVLTLRQWSHRCRNPCCGYSQKIILLLAYHLWLKQIWTWRQVNLFFRRIINSKSSSDSPNPRHPSHGNASAVHARLWNTVFILPVDYWLLLVTLIRQFISPRSLYTFATISAKPGQVEAPG